MVALHDPRHVMQQRILSAWRTMEFSTLSNPVPTAESTKPGFFGYGVQQSVTTGPTAETTIYRSIISTRRILGGGVSKKIKNRTATIPCLVYQLGIMNFDDSKKSRSKRKKRLIGTVPSRLYWRIRGVGSCPYSYRKMGWRSKKQKLVWG